MIIFLILKDKSTYRSEFQQNKIVKKSTTESVVPKKCFAVTLCTATYW